MDAGSIRIVSGRDGISLEFNADCMRICDINNKPNAFSRLYEISWLDHLRVYHFKQGKEKNRVVQI